MLRLPGPRPSIGVSGEPSFLHLQGHTGLRDERQRGLDGLGSPTLIPAGPVLLPHPPPALDSSLCQAVPSHLPQAEKSPGERRGRAGPTVASPLPSETPPTPSHWTETPTPSAVSQVLPTPRAFSVCVSLSLHQHCLWLILEHSTPF